MWCLPFFPLVWIPIFFAESPQIQHRWSVFKKLDHDEHVQICHVDYRLLGGLDRPIRRDHSRGTSRHFDCSQFFWCYIGLAHHVHRSTRINTKLSRLGSQLRLLPILTSAWRMELRSPGTFLEFCTTSWPIVKLLLLHHPVPIACCPDLSLQTLALFDCDDVAVHLRQLPEMVPVGPKCWWIFLQSKKKRFKGGSTPLSLEKRRRGEVQKGDLKERLIFWERRERVRNPRREGGWRVSGEDSNSRCALGDILPLFFKMDHLTSVGRTRLFWQFNVLWHRTLFLINAYDCKIRFFKRLVLFFDFLFGASLSEWRHAHFSPEFTTFIRFCAWHIPAGTNSRMTVSCICLFR